MRDFMSAEYVIRLEDPRQGDVMRMLSALDKHLQSLYPPESNHILDIAALCAPDIRFWVARREGEARGRRLGRAILACIEDQAAREGLALMRLETGIHQAAAHALYRSGGYAER